MERKYVEIYIEWKQHHKYTNKRNEHSYKVKVKFIHSHLPSEKKFSTKHSYPYCKMPETVSISHDHFSTYTQSPTNANLRLNHTTKYLTLLETSIKLIAMILRRIQTYYSSSTIQPFHKDQNDMVTIYKHQTTIG